jgi:hypothetical protein
MTLMLTMTSSFGMSGCELDLEVIERTRVSVHEFAEPNPERDRSAPPSPVAFGMPKSGTLFCAYPPREKCF